MSEQKMREALKLADRALSGANMNMAVVKRKISAALAEQPAQHAGVSPSAQGEAVAEIVDGELRWVIPGQTYVLPDKFRSGHWTLYTAPPAPTEQPAHDEARFTPKPPRYDEVFAEGLRELDAANFTPEWETCETHCTCKVCGSTFAPAPAPDAAALYRAGLWTIAQGLENLGYRIHMIRNGTGFCVVPRAGNTQYRQGWNDCRARALDNIPELPRD